MEEARVDFMDQMGFGYDRTVKAVSYTHLARVRAAHAPYRELERSLLLTADKLGLLVKREEKP